MTYSAKHKQGDRRQHYHTWAAKPGNLEAKANAAREHYWLLVSLGICTRCRVKDARPGFHTCGCQKGRHAS